MGSLVGRRIGRVQITALLGSGGTGEVYRGHDQALDRPVAVKRLRAESRFHSETKARLLREAKILARLEHQAICRLYDLVESADGEELLLLELVDGRPLREFADGEPGFDARLRVARDIAGALAAAHAAGVVHRDLKPDNVMITAAGEVKVLDFGIARSLAGPPAEPADEAPPPAAVATAAEAVTRIGSVVGTPGYMSPEQALGLPATAASDLYSLGVLLEELFTGKPVADRAGVGDPPDRPAPDAGAAAAGLDRPLAELLAELRSPDPTQRPDAAETARRLTELQQRPLRRRRRVYAALAAFAVAALVGATAWLSQALARPEPLLPPGARGQLLLLPFRNASGDPDLDWVELGLWELVRTTVEGTEGLELVPWDPRRDGGAPAAEVDGEEAGRLARATGATFLVDTAVAREADGYEITATVFAGGDEVDRGTVGAADPLVAGDLLADRLRWRLVERTPRVRLGDRFSGDALVNRLYAHGLQRIQQDPEAARGYFLAALDLDPRLGWARLQLARVDERLAHWPEAAREAAEVLRAARAAGDRRLEAAAVALAADIAFKAEPFAAAVERGEASLALHRALEDRAGTARDLERLGERHRDHARLSHDESCGRRARRYFAEAAALRRQLGDRRSLARAEYYLALNDKDAGRTDAARRGLQEALALARETGQSRMEALILNAQANLASDLGDLDLARRLYRRALALHSHLENPLGETTVLGNLGNAAADQGRWHEARALYTESAAVAREADLAVQLGDACYRLAWAHVVHGDTAGAASALAQHRALAGADWDQLPIEARIAALSGDFRRAVRLMEHSRAEAGDDWRPNWEEALASYRAGVVPVYEITDRPTSGTRPGVPGRRESSPAPPAPGSG